MIAVTDADGDEADGRRPRQYWRCSRSRNDLFRSSAFRRSKRNRWYCGDLVGEFPTVPACYVFIVDGHAVYVGSSNNLSTRMRAHRNYADLPWPRSEIFVKYRPSKKYGDWAMLELRLIRRLHPEGNCKGMISPMKAREQKCPR